MATKTHKLSPFRVLITVVAAAALGYIAVNANNRIQNNRAEAEIAPWYAGYVDAAATPTYAFEELGELPHNKNVVLSFIVPDAENPCTPTWGSAYTLEEAATSLDLDRRIARLRQQDGALAISFGGLINSELAVTCKDDAKLEKAYTAVIERYDVSTIDLDLEGIGLTDTDAGERRARAIANVQSNRKEAGKSLAVWVTLPIAANGLTEDGTNAISQLLEAGVDIAGVNAMTMNFGQSRNEGETMAEASIRALNELHRQLGVLYQQAGTELSPQSLWSKIGATPMLGQNDVQSEIFTFDDAVELNAFATDKGVMRMSFWSANRDRPCGDNYIDISQVSDSCSGTATDPGEYGRALSEGFEASLEKSAALETSEDVEFARRDISDDPATSPYQIWKEDGAYLQGTKVVWHRNVYEAKWWTQGDLPDDPVLQSWETPWKLIGPVLPGESPVELPSLPKGTYPTWNGKDVYEAGQRVLFDGAPYQAKWWTQGDSPAAASSNADGSPWVPLTQSEIEEILNR